MFIPNELPYFKFFGIFPSIFLASYFLCSWIFYVSFIALDFDLFGLHIPINDITLACIFTPQLQELATQLIDLWNLMDTPDEERSLFDHVTCNISASVDEVTVPGALALDLIEQVFKICQVHGTLRLNK